MTFVAGAVIWAGYTLGWFGWLAVTDRVPAGEPNTFWWPSIRDLIIPGRINAAVPPRLLKSTAGTLRSTPALQGVDPHGNPLTGTPGKPGGPPLDYAPPLGGYGSA